MQITVSAQRSKMKIRIFDTELNDQEIRTVRKACILSIAQINTLLEKPECDPMGALKSQRRRYFDLLCYIDRDPSVFILNLGSVSKHTLESLKNLSEPEIFIDDKVLFPGYACVLRIAFSGSVRINSKAYTRIASLIYRSLE